MAPVGALSLPLTAILLSAGPSAFARATPCGPSRVAGFLQDRNGTRTLSTTARAHYVLAETSDGVVGYFLLVRGRPGWYKGDAARGGGRVSGAGVRVHHWHEGTADFPVTFDPDSARLEVLGTSIGLDTANVILLDHIDGGPTRPQVRKALCVRPISFTDPIGDLLRTRPALRAFAGM